MMKRIWLYPVLGALLLTGCRKRTEDQFSETADERLSKAVSGFYEALYAAPGWKLFVYPQGLVSEGVDVGGLTYYLDFPDSNRVRMVSDFNVLMAADPNESGFRIRAIQRPSLVFDTYSYIHVAADPDETVSFSPLQAGGFGWGTDFDFSFTTAEPSDTMVLKGNFNQSDALLIRATAEEMNQAYSGRLAEILQHTESFAASPGFLYFPGTDQAPVGVSLNLYLYRIHFNFLSGGELVTISAPFSHTLTGLHFRYPVTVGGYQFQDLVWDEAANRYYIDAPGGKVYITTTGTPLFPFYTVLGRSVTTISVPVDPLPGQSTLFASVHTTIKNNLINSPYGLELGTMRFVFDVESGIMALLVDVFQNGNRFILQYLYQYSINSSNTVDFVEIGRNGNGELVAAEMQPFLQYIANDRFTLDYYTGTSPVSARFISQDRPSFFFTGNLD